MVEPGYVAGEETAAVRAINGGPGQTHRQAAAPVRAGRRRAADADQQCRDAGQPAVYPSARRAAYRATGTATSAGNLPGDRHRRWPRAAGSTRSRSALRSPNCLRCTGFAEERVRGVLMGGYFAGVVNREVLHITLDHESHPRPSAADWAAVRCPSSPTNARSRSRRRCWTTSTARTPGSADPASTARPPWPPRPAPCATARRPPTTSPACSAGRWCCAAAGACATLDAATNIAASLLGQVPRPGRGAIWTRDRCRRLRRRHIQRAAALRSGGRCDRPDRLRIKLDRTLCDGFGICAKHAPEYFSLDDWGYAVLVGDGTSPSGPRRRAAGADGLSRARHHGDRRAPSRRRPAARRSMEPDIEILKTEENEAEWGFTR